MFAIAITLLIRTTTHGPAGAPVSLVIDGALALLYILPGLGLGPGTAEE